MKGHLRLCFFAGLLLLGVIASARRASGARLRFADAERSYQSATALVSEIVELRQRKQSISDQKKPEQDVIVRVHDALAEAGIAVQDHFRSLRPESDAALPGTTGFRQQSMSVALQRLSLQEVGMLLDAWRQSQPLWTISRLDLAHSREATAASEYDVSFLISAIYVDSSPSTAQ